MNNQSSRIRTRRPRHACRLGPLSMSTIDSDVRAALLADELGLLIDGATNYAIYMLDPTGHVTIWNRGAERIKGWRQGEIVGCHFGIFYPPGDVTAGKPEADLKRASAEGRFEEEGWRRRKDGVLFFASITMTALHDEHGALRGFGKVVRDITDQRTAEQKRRVAEARLQEVRAELIHVSRLSAMGTMASTLAHELNQPLTAIASLLEGTQLLLRDRPGTCDPLIEDAISRAVAQAIRAGDIVRHMREFTLPRDRERRCENLHDLIHEAAALGLVGVREKGVAVRIDVHDNAACVLADRIQIQQVLINLIRNSVQSLAGMPRRLLAICTQVDGDAVRIDVSDTGGGFAPGIADRLFEAFATTKADGMGLGLSISRTIVEAHDGRIWATRADGMTTFHFTLPRTNG